jgi:type I restriction enzyme S subunit
MLPQAGKNQPEIRLKGFSGDWIEVKLEDTLLEQIKGKAQFDKLSNGVVEYLDAARLNRGKPFLCNAKNDVLQSDILIIWDGSNAGKVYRGFEGALGSTLKAYRTNEKYSSEFIFQHLLKNEKVIFAEFRTPNIPHVVKDFTSSYTVTAPNIEEQTAIGNFFKQLDDTLALQAKQLKALENLKKALLAKMFV